MPINIPDADFGRLVYKEHEGKGTYVYKYSEVEPGDFLSYATNLIKMGYTQKSSYEIAQNEFMVFEKSRAMVLIAHYPTIKQMNIVTEPDSQYFAFEDKAYDEKVQPKLTQINLEDHGSSYLVQISDGRFIMFDGGWEFEADADKLIAAMREQTPHSKPIVAAWIMTHPHIDHYRCYLAFERKYAGDIIIQKFIYNFPDTDKDSLLKLPELREERDGLIRFEASVRSSCVTVYRAHSGQIFEFGDTRLEVLSSPDDTFYVPVEDLNPLSLVFRMVIEGQIILWCADTYFESAKLAERWGEYLKADILQVPHHGFCGGDERTYDIINPHTCVVSVEEQTHAEINIHREHNKHLIYNLNVKDYYVSTEGNLTLTLPHLPSCDKRGKII